MRELYRRRAFTALVQNTDDHLYNLGFLYRGNGKWSPSPEFDVSPVPELGTTQKTVMSSDHGNALDINAVVEVAEYLGLGRDEADALLAVRV